MKSLRNIFIIFLIILLTFPKDVFLFISHIPAFISHYHHHNKNHGYVDLLGFIADHSSESNHQENHSDHKNLPFSHQHASDCHHFLTCLTFYHKEILKFHLPIITQKKIVTKQLYLTSDFIQTIWQPPKIS